MSDWFEQLFGFKEKQIPYDQIRDNFIYDFNTGILTSLPNKKQYLAGRFTNPSLSALRSEYPLDSDHIKKAIPGSIKLTEIISDVTALHLKPENKFAVFQAASQFNCLEFTSSTGKPENGITCYKMDKTQGPACAISCGPGTIIRNYFAFENDGQTKQNQINNLGKFDSILKNDNTKFFTVKNGYTISNDEKLKALNELLDKNEGLVELLKENYHAGIQEDTEAVSTNFGDKIFIQDEFHQKQIVTQVYSSACSVSYSPGSSTNWKVLASLILDCMFEFVQYAGVMNAVKYPEVKGARKVFLCPVGGGVFGNNMGWIVSAMEKALKKFQGVGLEVYLVSFGQKNQDYKKLLTKFHSI